MPPSSSLWSLFSNWFFLSSSLRRWELPFLALLCPKSAAKLRVWRENDAFIVGGEWGAKQTFHSSRNFRSAISRRVDDFSRRVEIFPNQNLGILPTLDASRICLQHSFDLQPNFDPFPFWTTLWCLHKSCSTWSLLSNGSRITSFGYS